jgi:hypothetical protein
MTEDLSKWTTDDLFKELDDLQFLIDGYPESPKIEQWNERRRQVVKTLTNRGFKFREER